MYKCQVLLIFILDSKNIVFFIMLQKLREVKESRNPVIVLYLIVQNPRSIIWFITSIKYLHNTYLRKYNTFPLTAITHLYSIPSISSLKTHKSSWASSGLGTTKTAPRPCFGDIWSWWTIWTALISSSVFSTPSVRRRMSHPFNRGCWIFCSLLFKYFAW